MHRRAFTLFELLAVIGIIVLLMAMLFPAFALVKRQAMKTKCKALLMQVSAACSNYRNVNGVYPENIIPNGMPDDTYQVIFGGVTTLNKAEDITEVSWMNFGPTFWEQIKTVDRDSFSTKAFNDAGKLVDPWGHVLRYRPSKYYPYKTPADNPKVIDSENPPMQDSFQLWSIGYNEKDDFGESGSDDIAAWQK